MISYECSGWLPLLTRLLVGQAEKAALRAAPMELVFALLQRARGISAAPPLRWHALEVYVRVQRILAALRRGQDEGRSPAGLDWTRELIEAGRH